MKFKLAAAVFVLLIAILSFVNSVPSRAQSKTGVARDSLSSTERDLLTEINQARANPQLYASYLEKLKPLFKGKEYDRPGHDPLVTEEGWSAVEDAIKFLKLARPLPALKLSQGLYLAAAAHVKDQSGTGNTGHKGSDSTFIEQRVKPFGTWQGGIGENLAYGEDSARERILTWLIDDGFPSRGHRRRLLSGEYKVAGISCGPHPQFTSMCVLTFAGGFTDLSSTSSTKGGGTNSTTTKTPSPKAKNANVKNPSVKNRKM